MPLDDSVSMGYRALDIVQSSPALVAADVSLFMRIDNDPSKIVRIGNEVVQGNSAGLADYWVSPAALAKLRSGTQGSVTVDRGPLTVGGHSLTAVSIKTVDADGYKDFIYDLESGLLLSASSAQRANPMSNVPLDQDAKITNTSQLLGVRRLGFSWAGAAPPADLTEGHQITYRGGTRMSLPSAQNMPEVPMSIVMTISKRAGLCVFVQANSSLANEGGMPQQSAAPHVYGSASTDALWVPPSAIAALKPGQVLDEDAATGFRVTFLGVQNGGASFQEQSPAQRIVRVFSTQSGLQIVFHSETQVGPGIQFITLQLAGGQ